MSCRTIQLRYLAPLLLLACSQLRAAPPYEIPQTPELCYEQRDTWFDTMIASREKLMAEEAEGKRPKPLVAFHSDVVRGGDAARTISVETHGVDELYLYTTGAPNVEYGAGDWADAVFIDAEGNRTPVTKAGKLNIQRGFHTVNCSLRSRVDPKLMIAGETYEHGINVQAPGKIRITVPAGTVRFESKIGIDDWVNPETYSLPQPFYYQPHLHSTRAKLEGKPKPPEQPRGAIRFHVVDAAGAARMDLWPKLEEEFSDEDSRRAITYGKGDRIFEADWLPGDRKELARRMYGRISYHFARMTQAPDSEQANTSRAQEVESTDELRARYKYEYVGFRRTVEGMEQLPNLDFDGLRLAISDLMATHGDAYPNGQAYLDGLEALELRRAEAMAEPSSIPAIITWRYLDLKKAALLSNPLLDFDEILFVRRTPHGDPRRANGRGYGVGEYIGLPRQSSKCNPGIEQPMNWENDIAALRIGAGDGARVRTLYHSPDRRLIKDLDLNWDGSRVVFSMPGTNGDWHVHSMAIDNAEPKQLTPAEPKGIHYYDPCWLPSDEIAMVSTAPLQGVPCNAGVIVGMMYKMFADGTGIRQLAFEQDHTYCPTVTNDGRIMYLRWDYTDTPHVWNRILMTMNPDGTGQGEYYGSNSYWPNSVFYARPIPGDAQKFVGIATGHHYGRVGDLILFDRSKGLHEASGVVQRIPGRGEKVDPVIEDKPSEYRYPKMLNPYPLSDKYVLVSCKPTPDSLWGIYLVDVFDNMVLLYEEEGKALLEPIPLRKSERPPVIPDRTNPESDKATIYLADVYAGNGLKDVPRGTIKELRLFTYHFAYQKIAGINHRVGADGPWEVKRVLGTVPVEEDGSASFVVPAKTPISIQPLDEEGKAVQLMRSWMTAMPGEMLSCVGCHENRMEVPPSNIMATAAARRMPSRIEPWYGPTRGFSFMREVQPVLDKYCVSCHNGEASDTPIDFRAEQGFLWGYAHGNPSLIRCEGMTHAEVAKKYNGIFPPSYIALRNYVRVGGLESDLHILPPMEFHADTSPLVEMLKAGHHNVELCPEAWDRLVTWIDLNTPCHGTWGEFTSITSDQERRRQQIRTLYGGIDENDESVVEGDPPFGGDITPVVPKPPVQRATPTPPTLNATSSASPEKRTLTFGDAEIELVRIPAREGRKPYWIATTETTNWQYAQFDPEYDSRFEHRGSWIFSEEYLGWPLNAPEQPVVRISCDEADAFCVWLSEETGMTVRLPTEAEWENACRAGTRTAFWFGDASADYSTCENFADQSIRRLAHESWGPKPPDNTARDERFSDGTLVTAPVGSYQRNPWGLFDMHGNVREWTAEAFDASGKRTVKGGSWRDLPSRCTGEARTGYQPYQKVFNVGFRIVCEEE